MAPSTQLFPEVVDVSTLGQKFTSPIFLPIGIEGQAGAAGTAVVATLYRITRKDEAVTLFDSAANSELSRLIQQMIDQGAGPIIASASAKGSAPTLVQRQAVWEKMESDEFIRLRLTDSVTQADLVALGTSCNNADLLGNKQFAIVGMAAATTKATLLTAATALAGATGTGPKRIVLVGPGVYDSNGALRSGSFLAAVIASEVAKNGDPANDLDLWPLPTLTAIEKSADGLPLFRRKVVAGVVTNDFEDLLIGGVSPVMPTAVPFGVASGVQLTHLRTVFVADATFDSLMTREIVDQVYLDVKNYIVQGAFLRAGNTQETRDRIASGVNALLTERRSWITPITQPDNTIGYGVNVVSSLDNRQVTVNYSGTVVRGISTVQVAAALTIPA